MHFEDGAPSRDIRPVQDHLAVESAWPQERGVEYVGSVRGGDDDDVGGAVEAVHLNQDLIERLLALIMTTAQTGSTLAANSINLINEDDTRRVALGLIEQVPHTAGADTDEHLDKFGTTDTEERHAGLTG